MTLLPAAPVQDPVCLIIHRRVRESYTQYESLACPTLLLISTVQSPSVDSTSSRTVCIPLYPVHPGSCYLKLSTLSTQEKDL